MLSTRIILSNQDKLKVGLGGGLIMFSVYGAYLGGSYGFRKIKKIPHKPVFYKTTVVFANIVWGSITGLLSGLVAPLTLVVYGTTPPKTQSIGIQVNLVVNQEEQNEDTNVTVNHTLQTSDPTSFLQEQNPAPIPMSIPIQTDRNQEQDILRNIDILKNYKQFLDMRQSQPNKRIEHV